MDCRLYQRCTAPKTKTACLNCGNGCEIWNFYKNYTKEHQTPEADVRLNNLLSSKQGTALNSLLNAINKVTAQHRHGLPVTKKALGNLANKQLDFLNLQGT